MRKKLSDVCYKIEVALVLVLVPPHHHQIRLVIHMTLKFKISLFICHKMLNSQNHSVAIISLQYVSLRIVLTILRKKETKFLEQIFFNEICVLLLDEDTSFNSGHHPI